MNLRNGGTSRENSKRRNAGLVFPAPQPLRTISGRGRSAQTGPRAANLAAILKQANDLAEAPF